MIDINISVVAIFFVGLSLSFALCAVTVHQVLNLKTVKQTEYEKKSQSPEIVTHDFRKRHVA